MPMRQIARLSLAREVASLRRREIPVIVFQPSAADIAAMGTDSLDPSVMPASPVRSTPPTKPASPAPTSSDRLAALTQP